MSKLTKDIEQCFNILKESYVFNDMEVEDYDMENEVPIEDNQTMTSDDRINQIRTIALEGIQEFAQDVTNPQYEFYKKVWTMCDKVITDNSKQQDVGGDK